MKAFYSDLFELPLLSKHRFPMAKYRMLRDRILDIADEEQIELVVATAATDEQIGLVHDDVYLHRVSAGSLSDLEVRRIGFPWSPQLVERSRCSVGATIDAARTSLVDGAAANLAGGTHHAFADRGQGYCVFNDVAVAIRVLQSERRIHRALIIDCDVHQGNGTAAIFASDESVWTFSIHGDRNFPFTRVPSDLDIALPDGTGDRDYLAHLKGALDECVPWDDADCVFYVAGADAFEHDRLGRLRLTKDGLAERDQLVLSRCGARELPVTVVMGGGYATVLSHIVDIHAATVLAAARLSKAIAARRPEDRRDQ